MGFLVVIASFVITPGQSTILLLAGWVLLIAIALSTAVVNWAPTLIGIPPFLATLVTFTALQGLSLLFRPVLGGEISLEVLEAITAAIGWLPIAAIAAVVIGLALDFAMRRSTWGVQLRAVGSNPEHARVLGVHVRRVQLSSYLVAGVLVFLASLLLMAQVGAGDPTVGTNYTLTSITAVVLGGASIFGGRGVFIGALVGALLIQQINTATAFLGIDVAWQTYMLGDPHPLAAGLYSKARDVRAA